MTMRRTLRDGIAKNREADHLPMQFQGGTVRASGGLAIFAKPSKDDHLDEQFGHYN